MTALAEVQQALDALATAARSGDLTAYSAQLARARQMQLTEEQILDSYRWGRRGIGNAAFDQHGRTSTT